MLDRIFCWLEVCDLAAVLTACHSWLAAVNSTSSVEGGAALGDFTIRAFCDSRLARHVSTLHVSNLDTKSLAVLKSKMPHLCALKCKLAVQPNPQRSLFFPFCLQKRTLILPQAAGVNRVLSAVGRLRKLLTLELLELLADEESARLLAALPVLATLDVTALRLPELSFLQPLGRLSTLSLWLRDSHASAAAVAAGLRHCPQLTSLAFVTGDLEGDHLAAALQPLPLLRSLMVRSLPRLQSLSILSAGSLPQSLTDLSVVSCAALVPTELEHIRGLTALQSLYLGCLFSEAPAAELPLLQLFQPPSAALPVLCHFQYAVPNRDALGELPEGAAAE